MRTPIIAGNWKMHHDIDASCQLAAELAANAHSDVTIIVAPVSVNLAGVADTVRGSSIKLAAQNMHYEKKGAFTGEVSASMLKAIGCDYILVGHSERRQHFFESDEFVNKKIHAALKHGLTPIICIGESLQERESGQTNQKVEFQVRAALTGISADQFKQLIFAYEPIWAIGTGKTASPAQAQEVHAHIRQVFGELYGESAAQDVHILYGGSVKPGNAAELIAQIDIDGALVGGASLNAEDFLGIIQGASAR